MKESYKEQLATDFGPKPYAGSGDAPGVASVFAPPYAKTTKDQEGYAGTSGCVETQASH